MSWANLMDLQSKHAFGYQRFQSSLRVDGVLPAQLEVVSSRGRPASSAACTRVLGNTPQDSLEEQWLQDAQISELSVQLAEALKGELHQWLSTVCLHAELRSAKAERSVGLAVSSLSQRLEALESARVVTFRRLSEVEAICQDVRRSLQQASPLPAATAELIKAELKDELHQLREQLHAQCFEAGLQSVDAKVSLGSAVSSLSLRLDALTSAGINTTRRLSEAEAVITAKTDNLSEMAALRDCVTAVMARCESQLSEAEMLRVQVKDIATEANNISEQTKRFREVTNCLLGFVEAEQIELSKGLRDAASTVGTEREVAMLAWRLSAVQDGQGATCSTVKSVSDSVAKAAAASTHHLVEECTPSNLSGLPTGVTPFATSLSKSTVNACNLSHLQATTPACAVINRSAQVEIGGVKKRVLELENTVSWSEAVDVHRRRLRASG